MTEDGKRGQRNYEDCSIKRRRIEMTKLYIFLTNLAKDERGQDMVEYALLAGFIAVAAGAVLPGISTSLSTIFSKMASVTSAAAAK
jgi:pilus assembly protein Flp/PilA